MEYQIEFWINGALWDVCAARTMKRVLIHAAWLCQRYGYCTVVGKTVS
jgi:hypothetical protein